MKRYEITNNDGDILREWLNHHKGETVYIGAKSGYLFMERVGDNTELKLTQLSREEEERLDKQLQFLQRKQASIDERYEDRIIRNEKAKALVANAKKEGKELKKPPKIYTDNELAIQKATEKAYLRRKVRSLRNYLKTYECFLDREVLMSYPSFTQRATICIIQGDEVGRFWFENEYRNPSLLERYKDDEDELYS